MELWLTIPYHSFSHKLEKEGKVHELLPGCTPPQGMIVIVTLHNRTLGSDLSSALKLLKVGLLWVVPILDSNREVPISITFLFFVCF